MDDRIGVVTGDELATLYKANPNLAELDKLYEQLEVESERGMVLTIAAFLDDVLKLNVVSYLVKNKGTAALFDGANPALGTFSARTEMNYALGLITPEERGKITLLRKVRNEFAHKLEASFMEATVVDFCRRLPDPLVYPPRSEWSAREKYQFTGMQILTDLSFRTRKIAAIKLKAVNWPENPIKKALST